MSAFFRLGVKTQSYEWGRFGLDSKAAALASADESFTVSASQPYAELWMGTHPNAPSVVYGSNPSQLLGATLSDAILGADIAQRFGGDLPFLFKVLSINKALSIQAHPDKALAQRLFAEFPQLYKDNNHKPEMAVALTPFEALIGFRALSEIRSNLTSYPEFATAVGPTAASFLGHTNDADKTTSKAALKALFTALMHADVARVETQIRALVARISVQLQQKQFTALDELLVRLDSQFPNDVGVFCALLLNFVKLDEGDAIFLAANEPHAYISGDCIECMAASDNVVRSGLTPKFKDVATLVEMLTYNHGPADDQILKGDAYKGTSKTSLLYDPPIEEFSIIRTALSATVAESEVFDGLDGPSILIVTEGAGTIVVDGVEHEAGFGFVFFVGANVGIELKSKAVLGDEYLLPSKKGSCEAEM
ncbi:Mannose-6-phosphate isomerase [Physocladia obscura]|uniref:Mannose-6-phosphate isomerase n=1 Tax=Physocladia obscura TaxID=109957 RepID=A0AAD5TBM2_9FUNG|nr:Mannose-6-phosphate isomerase [Physocladia obscura]